MSENTNITESPVSAQGAKGKIKKILPVVAVVVVLLVIITACFGGGSGKSVNKEAMKKLLKQNPKKILAMMPKGYEDNVMDYYDDYVKNKKQLREAVKQATSKKFDGLGKVKKIKFKESFKIDLNDLAGSGLTDIEAASFKGMYNGIQAMWKDITDCDEGYATIVDVTYKKDGEKTTEEYILFSFKYKGKWYSMNAMAAVYEGAWGYNPNKRG
ncbi:MAG: hypothetical protein NC177_12070 [Ruminococcus flavefaciens]|nr:hypothetical protein [Ruminococcus flavefaciens]